MRIRFPSEDLSQVTETTALDHLWSYGTDENFLQICEDTYGFFPQPSNEEMAAFTGQTTES